MSVVEFEFVRETADFAEFRCPCGYVVECTPDNVVLTPDGYKTQCQSCGQIDGQPEISAERRWE